MQLSEPLLALVPLELAPKLQLLIHHFQSLLIVLGELDFLPQLGRQVGALNGFHV